MFPRDSHGQNAQRHCSALHFGRGTEFSPPTPPWPSPAARPSASAAGAPEIGAGPRGSAFLGGAVRPTGGAMGSPWIPRRADPEWIHQIHPAKMMGWGLKLEKKWWISQKKKTVVNSSGWIEAPKSLMGEMMQKNNIGLNMIEWGFTTHKHKPNHGWSWGMQASRMWLSWGAVIELANRKVEDPWSKRKWCMTKNSRNAYMNKPRGHKRHNNGNVPYATRHGLSTGKHEALEHLGTGNKLMCLGLLTTYVLPAAMPDLKCMVICWDPSFGKPPSY